MTRAPKVIDATDRFARRSRAHRVDAGFQYYDMREFHRRRGNRFYRHAGAAVVALIIGAAFVVMYGGKLLDAVLP